MHQERIGTPTLAPTATLVHCAEALKALADTPRALFTLAFNSLCPLPEFFCLPANISDPAIVIVSIRPAIKQYLQSNRLRTFERIKAPLLIHDLRPIVGLLASSVKGPEV